MGIGTFIKGVAGGAVGMIPGLKDKVFGTPDRIQGPSEFIDPASKALREAQLGRRLRQMKFADREFRRAGRLDPKAMAEKQTKLLLGQAGMGAQAERADSQRRIQQMMAQRGLGGSSIGIGASLGAQRDIDRNVRSQRARALAGQLGLEDQLRKSRMGEILGAQQAFLNTGRDRVIGHIQGPQRIAGKQGIAGILGAAAGGVLGGPQGAMTGYQVGSGIGNVFGGRA